jgi:hypothetical protein
MVDLFSIKTSSRTAVKEAGQKGRRAFIFTLSYGGFILRSTADATEDEDAISLANLLFVKLLLPVVP